MGGGGLFGQAPQASFSTQPTIQPSQQFLLDQLMANPSSVTNQFAAQLFAPGTQNLMQNIFPHLAATYGRSAGAQSGLAQAQNAAVQDTALAQDQSIVQLLSTLFGGATSGTQQTIGVGTGGTPGALGPILGALGMLGSAGIGSGWFGGSGIVPGSGADFPGAGDFFG